MQKVESRKQKWKLEIGAETVFNREIDHPGPPQDGFPKY